MNLFNKGVIFAAAMFATFETFAQTNLNFTSIQATDEGAIMLSWTSVTNEVYAIQEADAFNTNADGTTAWRTLYEDYPSQGTNTFWLDTGNYYLMPSIPHPRNSVMRYYRIVDSGPDTTSDEPSISIVSPTNGFTASGSLTVTVVATTDQVNLHTKLYVDGQEMPFSQDGSNYVINTCEWPNGTHILFATAKCTSGFEGPMGVGIGSVAVGHAVSAFVPVVFNNLISEISFSQPFFNPDAGQTQHVSALFAADVNWTLQIADLNTNAVFTTNGSGNSLQFDWDGKGTGGTNLSAGVYYYYISAETNGIVLSETDGGGSGGGSPPAPALSLSSRLTTSALAVPTLPLPPLPPGMSYGLDDQGNEITNMLAPTAPESMSTSRTSLTAGGGFTPMDAGAGGLSTASSQNAPAAPTRPNATPALKVAGTFGIAYQTYPASSITLLAPFDGFPTLPGEPGSRVKLENYSRNSYFTLPALPYTTDAMKTLTQQMQNGAWQPVFVDANDDFTASDITGDSDIFNQVNLGILCVHGNYGSSADYHVNDALDIYLSVESIKNNSASFVPITSLNLSSSTAATNNLRWMMIFACNSLREENWNSLNDAGVSPMNGNLHLLLGLDTEAFIEENLAGLWSRAILGLSYPQPQKLREAWETEAQTAYAFTANGHAPIKFATGGWESTWDDTLQSTNAPSGELLYESVQVYP